MLYILPHLCLLACLPAFIFFQDQIFERLRRHVAPGGRLYLVGMQPLPDHPGERRSSCTKSGTRCFPTAVLGIPYHSRRKCKNRVCVFVFVFFSIPFVIFALLFSLSLLVITQTWGHVAGSSPSSPQRFGPRIFIARRLEPVLPSSTRIELRLPTISALSSSSFYFLQVYSKSHQGRYTSSAST